jgi:hypothetical protein
MTKATIRLPLEVSELEDISAAQDGSIFLGHVGIYGAHYHLELFRVAYDEHGEQYAAVPERAEVYDDLQRLYSGGYATFAIPGPSPTREPVRRHSRPFVVFLHHDSVTPVAPGNRFSCQIQRA